MKTIYFVTSNQGKYLSARKALGKFNIKVIQKSLDIPEPRGSFEEIAVEKARHAYKILRRPLIAMDAGFFIPSLNGFPMMFTNFVLSTIGVPGILKLAAGQDRQCEFREVLCYCDSLRKKPVLFNRVDKGLLAERPKGLFKKRNWSALHTVFIPDGSGKTLAQMSAKEAEAYDKNRSQNSSWVQFADFYNRL
jgi:XTP/dITP diphosphohydrolase